MSSDNGSCPEHGAPTGHGMTFWEHMIVLQYQAVLEGMKAENALRAATGGSPVYGEDAFRHLNEKIGETCTGYAEALKKDAQRKRRR